MTTPHSSPRPTGSSTESRATPPSSCFVSCRRGVIDDGLSHGAGYRDDDGSVWLAGTDGAIAHGRSHRRARNIRALRCSERRRPTPPCAWTAHGGGAPTGDFPVSSTGNFERFDGSVTGHFVSAPRRRPVSSFGRTHDIAGSPGEALATGLGEYPNQTSTTVPISDGRVAGTRFVAQYPSLDWRNYGIFSRHRHWSDRRAHRRRPDADLDSVRAWGSSPSCTIEVRWPESAERSRQVHVFSPAKTTSLRDDLLRALSSYRRRVSTRVRGRPTDEVVSLSGGIHLLRPFPNFLDTDRWGLSALVTRPHRPSCLPAHSDASFAQVR